MKCLSYIKKIFSSPIIFLFIGQMLYSSNLGDENPDSLRVCDFDTLFELIENSMNDSLKQKTYLDFFLAKAKSEHNNEEIINGYKNYIFYSSDNVALIYADSMVWAAEESKDSTLIGSAFLSKGIEFYRQKKYIPALDNYLMADRYITARNDKYLFFKTKYNIAHIKYYLGFYYEAIPLFKQCLEYFKAEDDRAYLNTIHSLASCYNRIGDFGHSSAFIKMGISEGKRMVNNEMRPYFILLEGINHYFKDNYATSRKEIESTLPEIIKHHDFANQSVGYFYLGKDYWALKKPETAMNYFRKVDKIFTEKNYIRADLRENYELMISYYKSKNNLKAQLYYVDKLLKADSLLNVNYKYLGSKINKEYDTKELLKEKEDIRKKLIKRERGDILLITSVAILFIFSVFISYRYFKNKKIYRQRFEELIAKNKKVLPETPFLSTKSNSLDINPEAVESVLKQLDKFEADKKFLDNDWTLVKLSAAFNSNTKYLSKIILHFRRKKFPEYINDLKIEYIIELLKSDKKIRNYTNKALAEESGFSSTQRFTNAFISKTGISPTYFIQELKKDKK